MLFSCGIYSITNYPSLNTSKCGIIIFLIHIFHIHRCYESYRALLLKMILEIQADIIEHRNKDIIQIEKKLLVSIVCFFCSVGCGIVVALSIQLIN